MPLWFAGLVLVTAIAAGATASVVGFGIGSLLTPIIAIRLGTDIAIVAVALPHLAGGLLRGWRLRQFVDRWVIIRFGLLSAAGGLLGALVFARLSPLALSTTLGALLLLTAAAGLTGWSEYWRPRGPLVWLMGALSGFFGGVAGNQGGMRAAALTTLGLVSVSFVATSTAIGIMIDLVRTPVYLLGHGGSLSGLWGLVSLAAAGVLAGTLVGQRMLLGLSPERFRLVISAAIGLLGLWLLTRGH